MRILIYCDDPGYGGTAINACRIAVNLSKYGFTVSLAASRDITDGLINFYSLGYDTQLLREKTVFSRCEPETVLLATKPDIVLFCDGSPDASLAAKAVCRDWNVPYIAMVNYVDERNSSVNKGYLLETIKALNAASEVVAMSYENLKLLQRDFLVQKHRSRVIYNGRPACWFERSSRVRRETLRHGLGLTSHDLLFLTVARYEPRKGYQYLIEAIQLVPVAFLPFRLVFAWIGQSINGMEEKLRSTVSSLGLSDRVTVVGERNDVQDWLVAADVFILPSESEGMPLCLIEAMGQGVPVVATSVSGIPELVGDAGILLPDPRRNANSMVAALAQAIMFLATSPEPRRSIGEAGRQRALTYFMEDTMIMKYVCLLQSSVPTISLSSPDWPSPGRYREPNLITAGSDILLGEDETSLEFLMEGWSHAEGAGRWTDGERARIVCLLPRELEKGFILTYEAQPFLGNGNGAVEVGLTINGRDMGRTVWAATNKLRRVEVAVFSDDVPYRRVELVFNIMGSSSPTSHGLSDDHRMLGIWMSRLCIEQLYD